MNESVTRRERLVVWPALLVFCGLADQAWCFEPVWDSVFHLTSNPADQYTGYGRQRSVAVDGAGDVCIAWVDQRTVPYQLWYRRFDQEQRVWLPETMLSNRPVNCQLPGVACDGAGDVHLVWHTETYPYFGIWYKRYDAVARVWKPDTLIDSGTSTRARLYPSVCCQPGERRVHVVWYGHPDTGMFYQVFHKEYRPDSGWNATEVVTDAPCFHDQVSIAADKDDNLCAVWCGRDFGGGFDQAYCRRRVGGAWQEVELVSDLASSLKQCEPCAGADDSGGFHVVWHGRSGSDVNQNIYHRLRRANGWSDITVLTSQAQRQQEYPSICCFDNGECHAVWRGQSSTSLTCQLYHAGRSRSGAWSPPLRLTDRAAAEHVSHPAIAGFADSVLHVVWHDVSSGNMDVYYMRGRETGTGLTAGGLPIGGRLVSVPNPARGIATLRVQGFQGSRVQGADVRVFDASGRLVHGVQCFQTLRNDGVVALQIDCRRLAAGVYILEAECAGSVARSRFVVLSR